MLNRLIILYQYHFFRESGGSKQLITDEEREKLASRLDEDLDKFIDNLQKTPYKDGWKEETWREVMIINVYSFALDINT